MFEDWPEWCRGVDIARFLQYKYESPRGCYGLLMILTFTLMSNISDNHSSQSSGAEGQEKYGDRKSWNWRKNQHYKPAWHHTTLGDNISTFALNIDLPCKILDFQKTAPRASLCCCDSDWHPLEMTGQGTHFDARCWTAEEISGACEVEWANGIDSATKIMRSKARSRWWLFTSACDVHDL